MPRQLLSDCLDEIFKHLDEVTLYSCLLVSRSWCEISVRILWTGIQNYNTLIACLPNESKEILHKNEIIISIPKSPLFNYVSFIKNLSINEIIEKIVIIRTNQPIILQSFDYEDIVEMFKMFMNQISLKKLDICFYHPSTIKCLSSIPFTTYPGAIDCLRNLSELNCDSNIYSEFFYQLSQICHHIRSLNITIKGGISSGLVNLISVQQNLKYLSIFNHFNCENLTGMISSLTKLPNNLMKLYIDKRYHYMPIPLLFIAKFINLQELVLSFDYSINFEDFIKLQDVSFPQLRILKFPHQCLNNEYLTKFLENNGNNLKELYLGNANDSLNLAIVKFCSKLNSLYTIFYDNEMETLKLILNGCQELESIEVWGGGYYLNEVKLLEVVAKYSPKKFYELKIHFRWRFESEFFSEELEPAFISWANRIPQKSLVIIIEGIIASEVKKESMETIEKFKKLGVIKKFEIIN